MGNGLVQGITLVLCPDASWGKEGRGASVILRTTDRLLTIGRVCGHVRMEG